MTHRGITYDPDKSHDKAVSRLLELYEAKDFSLKVLRRVCGIIVYSGVYLIPEYERIPGERYSIENMCSYIPGLITRELHDVLYIMSDIVVNCSDIDLKIKAVITDCFLNEYLDFLQLPIRETSFILILCAMQLRGADLSTVLSRCDDKTFTVQDLLHVYLKEE